jgi:hypothetical protein
MPESPLQTSGPTPPRRGRLPVLLTGAALLLGAVLGVLWGSSSQEPLAGAGPASPPVRPAPEAPAPQAARPPPRAPVAAPAPAAPEAHEDHEGHGHGATVVPLGPEDEIPELESSNPLPQENDPIEPEKPQTARWKLGKTERITELLGREVQRMEQERDQAVARGDAGERQRLDILIRREQTRLTRLREEISKLAAQAATEPPEP